MKNILITGGKRGLGFEIAANLLEHNSDANIILSCRTEYGFNKAVESLSKRFNKDSLPLTFLKLDLLNENEINDAVKFLEDNNLTIDILVNNAAVVIVEASPTEGHDTIKTNFIHPKLFTNQLLEKNLFNHNFRIINVSAILGNITIIKDEEIKSTIPKITLDNIDKFAYEYIEMIDSQGKIEQMIHSDKSLYPEYALSKLLLNNYSAQIVADKNIVDKN